VLILLDENLLSKKLKKPFLDVGHTVQNVEDMGWRGTKDRELLSEMLQVKVANPVSWLLEMMTDANP